VGVSDTAGRLADFALPHPADPPDRLSLPMKGRDG